MKKSRDLPRFEYFSIFEADFELGLVKRTKKTAANNANMDWNNGNSHSCGYRTVNINGINHYLHRVLYIMRNGNIADGMQVDHINGDRSDNRIRNLRVVSNQDNHRNITKQQNTSSRYIGVCWDKSREKWRSGIMVDKVNITIGYFDTEIQAANAYKRKAYEFGFHANHGKSNNMCTAERGCEKFEESNNKKQ